MDESADMISDFREIKKKFSEYSSELNKLMEADGMEADGTDCK